MYYHISKTQIIVGEGSEVYTITSDDERYAKLITMLGDASDEEIKEVLKDKKEEVTAVLLEDEDFSYDPQEDVLLYKGKIKIERCLKDTVVNLLQQGYKDLKRYHLFLDNLLENPSATAVNELYDFMDYEQLPITEDGYLIAYKGVSDDYYSVHGNTDTLVLDGKVDDRGRIYNGVGEVVKVARNQVDDNRHIGCSFGLHAGSMDYASSWGQRTMLVQIDPKDVVSVPSDCSFQKVRVCKYIVVCEIERKVESVFYDTNLTPEENDKKIKKIGKDALKALKEFFDDLVIEEYIEVDMIKDILKWDFDVTVKKKHIKRFAKLYGYNVEKMEGEWVVCEDENLFDDEDDEADFWL